MVKKINCHRCIKSLLCSPLKSLNVIFIYIVTIYQGKVFRLTIIITVQDQLYGLAMNCASYIPIPLLIYENACHCFE